MPLEDRYRRLLRAYPRSYRDRRGDEMLATLLDQASPGQERPTSRQTTDLLHGALRERLGLHAVPGLAEAVRLAAPIGLALAGGLAASEVVLGNHGFFAVLTAALWCAAVLTGAVVPRYRGPVVAAAWIATVVAAVAAVVGGAVDRPIIVITVAAAPATDGSNVMVESVSSTSASWYPPVYSIEALLGLLAVVAVATGSRARRGDIAQLAAVVGTAALIGVTIARDGLGASRIEGGYPYPTWLDKMWLVPLLAFLIGVAVVVRRRTTGLLWAALLLTAAAPTSLMLWSASMFPDYVGVPSIGLSAFLTRGVCVVLIVVMVTLAAVHGVSVRRDGSAVPRDGSAVPRDGSAAPQDGSAARRDGSAALAKGGMLCLAAAAGGCLYLLLAGAFHGHADGRTLVALAAAPLAAIAVALGPAAVGRAATIAALALVVGVGFVAPAAEVGPWTTGAIALLLLVAAATVGGQRGLGRRLGHEQGLDQRLTQEQELGLARGLDQRPGRGVRWGRRLELATATVVAATALAALRLTIVGGYLPTDIAAWSWSGTVVLPVAFWAVVFIVRADRTWWRGLIPFAAGGLWASVLLHAGQSPTIAAIVGVCLVLAVAARFSRRLARRRRLTAGPALSPR